jgi:quercetin dioxygenase-like cupin family protein
MTSLDKHMIGVCRGSSVSHWERHPAGDEMLHILEGEVDVDTLTDEGPVRATLTAGSVFICPRGLWHRLTPKPYYSMLFATPGDRTEIRAADDPRMKADSQIRDSVQATGMAPAADINRVLAQTPRLVISDETTAEEANAAVGLLAKMDDHLIGVMQYSGLSPWERHPDGDELLHALDGEVEVTVLTDEGPVHKTLSKGNVFICPRGLWHRQFSSPSVTMLFATPTRTTEVSFADDPRAAL